jgi:adenylate kinase family enzyme
MYIIGPSGSGKTYLAKKISEKLNIPHINLDYFFFKHVVDKKREEIPENEWRKNLDDLLVTDNWIIEGVNPIREVFNTADKIVFLNPPITIALFRQWKRYFTDPKQRKEHGFVNNLKLSRYLIKQYMQEEDKSKAEEPKYSRVTKINRILTEYKNKTIILENSHDVLRFLSSY